MILSNASVSVVCPTFNSQAYIERTLESIRRQTAIVDEIIICDDGSADNTIEVVERFFSKYGDKISCKLLANNHNGPGFARNTGIMAAKGSWVFFIDSDDTWEDNKIEKVLKVINKNPEVNFICHNEYRLDLHGKRTLINCSSRYSPSQSIVDQLYWSNLFSTSAVACKRSLLIDKGMFDEGLMSIQDYELWLRISPYIKVFFMPDILGTYIERRGNITSRNTIGRFVNETTTLFRHRKLVPIYLVLARIPKLILSHAYHIFRKFVSR